MTRAFFIHLFKLLPGLLFLLSAGIIKGQTPVINSFSPEKGLLGSFVTITGNNFDPVVTNNIVYFGATQANVVTASPTQLVVHSPVGTYQPITVTVKGLTAYSSRPFVPLTPGPPFTSNSLTPVKTINGIGVHSIAVSDFDNDGKADLAVVGSGAALNIFKNTSTPGLPAFSTPLSKAGLEATGVTVGDLNGDGFPDVVAANYGADKISVFINSTAGGVLSFDNAITYPTGVNPYHVAITDFNGDGKPDIVVTNESFLSTSVSVFQNATSSAGLFSLQSAVSFSTSGDPRGVSVGDVDMDGKVDIIVACQAGYLSILRNVSTLSNINFAAALNISLPSGSSPESAVVADFDDDLKIDIGVADNQSSNISVLKNTSSPGNVSFLPRQDFAAGQWDFGSCAGDINGDGMPDIVVTNQGDNSVSVFINASMANNIAFAGKIDFPVGNWPRAVAMADVDGDNKPDLIVGNNSANTISILSPNTQKTQAIITFEPPVKIDIDADNILRPVVSSNNTEIPITFTSSNPAVAYVGADGLIHVIAPGTTIITANQAASANFLAAAQVSQTYVIKQYQVISFPPISARLTCDIDFPANATSQTPQPLFYNSSNPAVATISPTGIIHITGAGSTTITVTQPGNDQFIDASPQSQQLIVSLPVPPTVTVTANNNSVCSGSPVTFTAAAPNAGANPTYQWQVNGAAVGTNSPQFKLDNVLATDVIRCIVTPAATCSVPGSNQVSVSVQPYITPSVSLQYAGDNLSICPNMPLTLTATPLNGGINPTYQWYINDVLAHSGSEATFSFNKLNKGDKLICKLIIDPAQCVTSTTAVSQPVDIANIITPDIPEVSISASANNIYSGIPVTFTAVCQLPNVFYQWQINNVNVGGNTVTFTSATLKNGDKVTCTVTASGACIIPVTSDAITMNLSQPVDIDIPNSFTPNGDGINDVWEIKNLAFYSDCLVKIFNRYGQLLHQSKGYVKAWDGTVNGRKLPAGTYFYIIQTDLLKGAQKSGPVTIVY